MTKLLFIATVLFTVLSFSSCKEDDPVPMIWEFSNYDLETAPPEYSGNITLKCTNYPQITLNANNADGTFKSAQTGFTVIKVDDSTLKITFKPIVVTGENGIYDIVLVDGRNGKKTGASNMSISRIRKDI